METNLNNTYAKKHRQRKIKFSFFLNLHKKANNIETHPN